MIKSLERKLSMARNEVDYYLRDFEWDIINEFKPPEGYEMKRPARGAAKARTGLWIKDHLLDVEEDSITGIWKWRNYFAAVARNMGVMIRDSQYRSFWSYIYILSKIGLIEHVRSEPGSKNPDLKEKYYGVVKDMIDSPDWENPIPKYLSIVSGKPEYSSSEFKESPREAWSKLCSERTHKWRESKPRKAPGRPRKSLIPSPK